MRKLVAALGDRAQPLRRRLWCELATVYENQLGDRLSARIAYDMAARLAPDDVSILRKSAEMNAEDPTAGVRWRVRSQRSGKSIPKTAVRGSG